jgi:hypothetical protein
MFEKLTKWLYLKLKKQVRENHLKRHHNDIKCPNCKQWFSVTGVEGKHEREDVGDWGVKCKCGGCGYISHWNIVAFPFPALSDDKGTPL